MLLLSACAATEGGEQRSGGSARVNQGRPNMDADKTKPSLGNDAAGDSAAGDKVDEQTDAIPEEETESGSIKSASDQDICAYLKKQSIVAQKMTEHLRFFCDQGGLEKLRQTGFTEVAQTDSGGNTHLEAALAVSARSTYDKAANILQLFCRDNAAYRQLAPQAFGRVQSITPAGVSATGCTFNFVGKKVVFFQPQYSGAMTIIPDANKTIFVTATYLTQKGSEVNDARDLNIAVVDGEAVVLYAYTLIDSAHHGFHSMVVSELEQGGKALMQGAQVALQR